MHGEEIAIIGLAGRFPGASNARIFWKNLMAGKESISFLTDDEVKAIDNSALVTNSRYVRSRGGVLSGVEYFDNAFFGYTPREVEIMDPQFHILHECVWEALEDAGYTNDSYQGLIGLYAGASGNFQWQFKLTESKKYANRSGLAGIQFVERDFLPTLISYNLNLKGPSYNVQTACSTSLVAVHLACQAILNGECDVALAGGVSIANNTENGYLYQDGSILSPDGHCRAFDAKAKGSIYGSGAGIVALKMLDSAIADSDHIYAVIKGSAVNNDGKRKVGFTAPSIIGQSEVIKAAHLVAEVNPRDIGYIEAHGTGTELGDPIEVEALKTAFNTSELNFCGIGSVKTNVGHLDAAAGVTGLIKTALALKNKKIPASLNFDSPNPKIDFKNSPFYVVDTLRDWQTDKPRLAGVSSFGIGGTNAHVVLEEAPVQESHPSHKAFHLLKFSARSKSSCLQWLQSLSEYLKDQNDNIGDIAYTLMSARKDFSNRGFMVATDLVEVARKIEADEVLMNDNGSLALGTYSNVFMFSGQGAQYVRMGFDLYKSEPFFKNELSECFKVYQTITQVDLFELLYPEDLVESENSIDETKFTQPLLFIFEYALAKFIMHLGIKPSIMIGHSIGEYVAACLSGVFTLEDALNIVIKRGNLIQAMPKGSMLSIPIDENSVKEYLKDGISLAAVNSTKQCVVSGPTSEIQQLHDRLTDNSISSVLLKTSHAFHSSMMEPALKEFEFCFNEVSLNSPSIPFLSNVTGELITDEEATSPTYWAHHLRRTVRFALGIEKILAQENVVFLEVGPGNSLSNFVLKNEARNESHKSISFIRHQKQKIADDYFFYESLGKLWLLGVDVKMSKLYESEARKKVSLPTYCFEKQKVNSLDEVVKPTHSAIKEIRNPINKWFYNQVWEQKPIVAVPPSTPDYLATDKHWLLFIGEDNLSLSFVKQLAGFNVTTVKIGRSFSKESERSFIINPLEDEHFPLLVNELGVELSESVNIIHLWSLHDLVHHNLSLERCQQIMNNTFYSVVSLIRTIGFKSKHISLTLITRNTFEITGDDCTIPELACNVGLLKILPLEYKNLSSQIIDLTEDHLEKEMAPNTCLKIFNIIASIKPSSVTALRGLYQWIPRIKPIEIDKPSYDPQILGKNKVYVILGLGGMGIYMAKYLTESLGSTVFIMHRSEFPTQENWRHIIGQKGNDQVTTKIKILENIRLSGKGKVNLINCDITDKEKMQREIEAIERSCGKVYGVIQATGTIDQGGIVQRRTNSSIYENMKSKVQGTIIIDTLFKDRALEVFILFSSLGNELFEEKYGEIAYSAANEFIDAYVNHKSHIKTKIVIDWCDWKEVGMAVKAIDAMFTADETRQREKDTFDEVAIRPEDGIDVFSRVCDSGLRRVLIYPFDLLHRLEERDVILLDYNNFLEEKFRLLGSNAKSFTKPTITFENFDDGVVAIWKDYLGHKEISVHDNIFELGASSLDVVQINNILKSSLNIDVPVTTLFEYPTIASFLKHIKGNDVKEDIAITSERIDKGIDKLEKLKRISTINT